MNADGGRRKRLQRRNVIAASGMSPNGDIRRRSCFGSLIHTYVRPSLVQNCLEVIVLPLADQEHEYHETIDSHCLDSLLEGHNKLKGE